ncbi:hypothetical protein U8326_11080 [Tsuneonella sp. CC-YZS046]|uniref:hypothetical protein n=1 Tax=Tsuneonella sp. CC-YZS046 TaxID=3042152 RepID=UPI002D782B01|nr:hypothetical protein [Tsuneonella sp. CC-YZS046]WRO65594.1 hypothetical protein U8326_11080 [Tsuneonella sp. CC-YZS046]
MRKKHLLPEAGWRRRDLALLGGGAATGLLVAGSAGAQPLGSGHQTLPPGIHRITEDLVIAADLSLAPGARIEVAPGRTLTLKGHFSAPVSHIFTGAGWVDLNHSRTPAAFPEWWGAIAGDGNADCLPAFSACLAAHPIMLLRAADYYLSDSFVIERPFARIWGAGYRGAQDGQGTRLLVKSGTVDVLRVGPARFPGAVNDFLQGVDIRWMELGRTLPVAPDAAGLRAQYLLHCRFEGLSARESSIGFAAKGVVRSYFSDCIAFRSLPGSTPGSPYRGFLLGGAEQVGLAGANGSIFVVDCNVSIGGAPGVADSVGLLLEAGFADSFIENFEATGLQTGIRIAGDAGKIGGMAVAGHSNLHIRMPIIDQCSAVGIELLDLSGHAIVDISDPYVAVAPGARAAIAAQAAHGAWSIIGGQLIGRSDSNSPGATGLWVQDSSGLDVTALKLVDFASPVHLSRCTGSVLRGQIHNPGKRSDAAAVALDNCSDTQLDLRISGKTKAFANGIAVNGQGSGVLALSVAMIDGDAIAGEKILSNGRSLGSSGRHGAIDVTGM